ncbi:MAG TPA: 4-hydroxythreonine-4-phosphate dehydrogenase PdxA [Burkholderiales bacterium]|nr:4-hydroxythreonine-4-phosphate dehydrogenase PdxA [Burkholderiales bacterium]
MKPACLPRVALATGDPAGIGPEISLKAARDPQVRALCDAVLVGSREVLALHAAPCGIALDDLYIRDVPQAPPRIGEVAPEHGRAALEVAAIAIEGALAGKYDAVVGAPHTEAAIHAAGLKFDGYPSFVARLCGLPADEAMLMLCFAHQGREVRIAHVTLHASVRQALALISGPRIIRTLRATEAALQAIGISRPRIAVSGVNPHAGETGAFGREEIEVIAPAITQAQRAGMAVDGPYGADTLIQRKGYDAYVVMLHDQGHVAAKVLALNRAAALIIGTPVLFSSVGHGSALDIAGQGKADASAMREAITRLVTHRRRAPAT